MTGLELVETFGMPLTTVFVLAIVVKHLYSKQDDFFNKWMLESQNREEKLNLMIKENREINNILAQTNKDLTIKIDKKIDELLEIEKRKVR